MILVSSVGVNFSRRIDARSRTGCLAFASDHNTGSATGHELPVVAWMNQNDLGVSRAVKNPGKENEAITPTVDFRKKRRLGWWDMGFLSVRVKEVEAAPNRIHRHGCFAAASGPPCPSGRLAGVIGGSNPSAHLDEQESIGLLGA